MKTGIAKVRSYHEFEWINLAGDFAPAGRFLEAIGICETAVQCDPAEQNGFETID